MQLNEEYFPMYNLTTHLPLSDQDIGNNKLLSGIFRDRKQSEKISIWSVKELKYFG